MSSALKKPEARKEGGTVQVIIHGRARRAPKRGNPAPPREEADGMKPSEDPAGISESDKSSDPGAGATQPELSPVLSREP